MIMAIYNQNVLGTISKYDPSSPSRSTTAQPPLTPTPTAPSHHPFRATTSQLKTLNKEKVMPIRFKSGPRKGNVRCS